MIDHDNLEEFADPRTYDREDSSDTGVAFYTALARETGGPVLELACGTGRVSIPIARLGLAVTGLDIVPGMVLTVEPTSATEYGFFQLEENLVVASDGCELLTEPAPAVLPVLEG